MNEQGSSYYSILPHEQRKRAIVAHLDQALWTWVSDPAHLYTYDALIGRFESEFHRFDEKRREEFFDELRALAGTHATRFVFRVDDSVEDAWPREEIRASLVALVDRHYTNEHGELAEKFMRILESNESLHRCRSVLFVLPPRCLISDAKNDIDRYRHVSYGSPRMPLESPDHQTRKSDQQQSVRVSLGGNRGDDSTAHTLPYCQGNSQARRRREVGRLRERRRPLVRERGGVMSLFSE